MNNNTFVTPVNVSDDMGPFSDFEGYPIIYPITLYHMYYTVVFGRVLHGVWYVIGFFGNILSLKLWCLPRVRRASQASPYLITITATDILYQTMHVFFYMKYFWGLSSVGVTGLCQLWNILNLLPQYASQLLVFGFTTEQFVAVLRPLQTDRFARADRAPVLSTVIICVALLLAIPQSAFWAVDESGFCEIRTENSVLLGYKYWTIFTETLIFLVIPVTALIFNMYILRYVQWSLESIGSTHFYTATPSRFIREHKRCCAYKPAMRTLMLVSLFRIISQLPVSVTYTLQNFEYFNFGSFMGLEEMSSDPQWQRFLSYWDVRMLAEIIGASQHALGVFIFCATSRHFRSELLHMFKFKPKRLLFRQNARYHSASQHTNSPKTPRTNVFVF